MFNVCMVPISCLWQDCLSQTWIDQVNLSWTAQALRVSGSKGAPFENLGSVESWNLRASSYLCYRKCLERYQQVAWLQYSTMEIPNGTCFWPTYAPSI